MSSSAASLHTTPLQLHPQSAFVTSLCRRCAGTHGGTQSGIRKPESLVMFRYLPRGGPAVALFVTIGVSATAVAYSHYQQVRDKAIMRAGVERDRERLAMLRERRRREKNE